MELKSRRSYLVKDQGVNDSETDGGDLLLVVLDLGLPIGFKGLDGLGGDLQWGWCFLISFRSTLFVTICWRLAVNAKQ